MVARMRGDAELLAEWRGGDAAAGEELFERYYPSVTRFFSNKVAGDPADLIQQTFVSCLQSSDRIADAARFRSYLFGVAYNVLRQHFKRQETNERRFDAQTQSALDLSPGPGTLVAAGSEQRLLLRGLRRIPLQFQVVLELYYWEEMTSAAIATALGEPHGTVRTRLRRARQLLQRAVESIEPGAPTKTTASELEGWAARIRTECFKEAP